MAKDADVVGNRSLDGNVVLQRALTGLWAQVERLVESNKSMRQDAGSLQAEFERRLKELEVRNKELGELRDTIEHLRADLANREDRLSALSDVEETFRELTSTSETQAERIAELQRDLRQTQLDRDSLSQRIDKMQMLVDVSERQRAASELLERQLADYQARLAEVEDFETNKNLLQRELARRNADLNAKINEILTLRTRVAELENTIFEIPRYQGEIEQRDRIIRELTHERDGLARTHEKAEQYARLHEIHEQTLEDYSQTILNLKLQNTALERQVLDAKDTITRLEEQIAEEQRERERLHVEIKTANEYEEQIARQLKSIDEYSGLVIELKKQRTSNDQVIRTLSEKSAGLQIELDNERALSESYREKLSSQGSVIESLKVEKSSLQDQLALAAEQQETISSTIDELRAGLTEAESNKARLVAQNESLQVRIDELEEGHLVAVGEFTRQRETFEADIQALISTLESLREKSDREQAEFESVQSQLREKLDGAEQTFQQHTAEHAAELSALQAEYDSLKSENQDYKFRLEAMVSEDRIRKEEIDTLQQKLSQTSQELDSARQDFTQKVADLAKLDEELSEQKSRHATLESEHEYVVAELRETVANLNAELEMCKARLLESETLLESQRMSLEQDLAAARESQERVQREADEKSKELKAELDQIGLDLAIALERLAAFEEHGASSEAEAANLRVEIVEARKGAEREKEAIRKEYQALVDESVAETSRIAEELKQLREDHAKSKSLLESFSLDQADLLEASSGLRASNEELSNRLEEQLGREREMFAAHERSTNELRSTIAELEKRLQEAEDLYNLEILQVSEKARLDAEELARLKVYADGVNSQLEQERHARVQIEHSYAELAEAKGQTEQTLRLAIMDLESKVEAHEAMSEILRKERDGADQGREEALRLLRQEHEKLSSDHQALMAQLVEQRRMYQDAQTAYDRLRLDMERRILDAAEISAQNSTLAQRLAESIDAEAEQKSQLEKYIELYEQAKKMVEENYRERNQFSLLFDDEPDPQWKLKQEELHATINGLEQTVAQLRAKVSELEFQQTEAERLRAKIKEIDAKEEEVRQVRAALRVAEERIAELEAAERTSPAPALQAEAADDGRQAIVNSIGSILSRLEESLKN